MPKRSDIKSVLIIGAGPIVIGQACEFDYSGAQACKALMEEGIRVILINSNPATIMTDPIMADATYIEPIEKNTIEKIIQIEKPDAILPTMGGQTALNATLDLYNSGILRKNDVEIIGVEAGGKGVNTTQHAATLTKGEFGVLHGAASMMLQNEDGQVTLPHSISAGLDYPGIGPEHSYLSKSKRVKYKTATDDEALDAFKWMSEKEGIIPALETAHAIAYLKQKDNGISKNEHVILNLSGRGDKDVSTVEQSMKKKYE